MASSALPSTDVVVLPGEKNAGPTVAVADEDDRHQSDEALPLDPEEVEATSSSVPASRLAASFIPTGRRRPTQARLGPEPSLARPRSTIVLEVQNVMKRLLTGESAGSGRGGLHPQAVGRKGRKASNKARADLFRHVFGIVNPGSGENAASSMVLDSMRHQIGPHRVLALNKDVFRDPSGLRAMLKRYAVVYFSPINGRNMDDVLRDEAERAEEARARQKRKERKEKRRKRRWGRSRSPASDRSSRTSSRSSSSSSSSHSSSSSGSSRSSTTSTITNSSPNNHSRGSHAAGAKANGGGRRRRVPAMSETVDSAEMRGTVFVSGGDGTMAFVLEQIEVVRLELQLELSVQSLYETSTSASHAAPTRRLFATPAVAPIPLGTGNDFANCLGFGTGFTKRRQGLAGWLCCANTDVGQLMEQAAAAPAIPFDRWRASFVPLRVAQRHCTHPAETAAPPVVVRTAADKMRRGRGTSSTGGEVLTSGLRHSVSLPSADEPAAAADSLEDLVQLEASHSAASPPNLVLRASGKVIPRGHDASLAASLSSSSSLANQVHNVDWEAIQRGKDADGAALCRTYGIINYLGIGFDAYVTCKFDETRKKYPQLCSTRVQNKAVYGFMGLRGSIKCKSTRKLIPMVCIPRPSTTLHKAVGMAPGGSGGGPLSVGAGTTTTATATPPASSKPDMVALSIPDMTKALVMTNVNSYSAGAHPWDPLDPEVFYEPIVGIHDTNVLTAMPGRPRPVPAGSPLASGVFGASLGSAFSSAPPRTDTAQPALGGGVHRRGSSGASATSSNAQPAHHVGPADEEELPVVTPVAVNDRRFELQAMGGVWHYGAMGAGLTSAVKMAQPSEMFVFVLCTPDDLMMPEGVTSLFTQTRLKGYEARIRDDPSVQASLYVQIDGEAMPRIQEPTIIHVEANASERVFVRCVDSEVVWQKNALYRALVAEALEEQTDD